MAKALSMMRFADLTSCTACYSVFCPSNHHEICPIPLSFFFADSFGQATTWSPRRTPEGSGNNRGGQEQSVARLRTCGRVERHWRPAADRILGSKSDQSSATYGCECESIGYHDQEY